MMNKRKVWFSTMVLYVLLLDPEEVVQEKTHVTELAELNNSADFSSAGTGTDSIVIDGKGSPQEQIDKGCVHARLMFP